MKKYFTLQLKRFMLMFPFAITITVVLLLSLALILAGFFKMSEADSNNQTFKIGISGDTDNRFFQLGKNALETFDSSRYSMAFIEMDEAEARSQMDQGKISAYIVVPDGFIENALTGEIDSIKYVTSSGSIGLISIFKNEITRVVEDILICSQKGVYGMQDALDDNGYENLAGKHINKINIEYIDLIINRGETYSVEELGVSGGLSATQYLLCGFFVLFVFIIGLPYVGLFVKRDMSLQRVISAKGYGYKRQVLSELLSYAVVMLLTLLTLGLVVFVALKAYPSLLDGEIFATIDLAELALQIIPVILLIASFCVMIFEFVSDIVSAVLLHFFATVSLCYVSGCMYPIYTFPVIIQRIAPFLPMGAVRVYLQGCLANEFSLVGFCMTMFFTILFFVIAMCARRHRINTRS